MDESLDPAPLGLLVPARYVHAVELLRRTVLPFSCSPLKNISSLSTIIVPIFATRLLLLLRLADFDRPAGKMEGSC